MRNVAILLLLLSSQTGCSQAALKVGDRMPEFEFNDKRMFGSSNPGALNFKAKLLVLDFWATSCFSCLAAFPKLDSLQQEFKDHIQVILINPSETTDVVSKRMGALRNKKIVEAFSNLAQINGGSIWKQYFPYTVIPHHVWIDEKGIIVSITNGYNTNRKNIQEFLCGKLPKMLTKNDFEQAEVRSGFVSRDNNLKPEFYSGFYKFQPNLRKSYFTNDTANGVYIISYANKSLLDLLEQFYSSSISNIRNRTLFKVKDKSVFLRPTDESLTDQWEEKNLFTYEICIPNVYKDSIDNYVREDLNQFLKLKQSVVAHVEKKKFRCFVLEVRDQRLLKTKGGTRRENVTADSISLQNVYLGYLQIILAGKLENVPGGKPFILDGLRQLKVDIELYGDLSNYSILKRQLKKYGLNLKIDNRFIDVLVIQDCL